MMMMMMRVDLAQPHGRRVFNNYISHTTAFKANDIDNDFIEHGSLEAKLIRAQTKAIKTWKSKMT